MAKSIELFCNVGDFVYMNTYGKRNPIKAKVLRINITERGITYYTDGFGLAYFSESDIGVEVFDTEEKCRKSQ